MRVNTGRAGRDSAAAAAIIARARDAVQGLPGVSGVALGQSAPFRASMNLWRSICRDATSVAGCWAGPAGLSRRSSRSRPNTSRCSASLSSEAARSPRPINGSPNRHARRRDDGAHVLARRLTRSDNACDSAPTPCHARPSLASSATRDGPSRSRATHFDISSAFASPEPKSGPVSVRSHGRPAVSMEAGVRTAAIARSLPAPFVEVFAIERLVDVQSRQWRLGAAAFVSFGMLRRSLPRSDSTAWSRSASCAASASSASAAR